jgi:hypothetical protein
VRSAKRLLATFREMLRVFRDIFGTAMLEEQRSGEIRENMQIKEETHKRIFLHFSPDASTDCVKMKNPR